jgi:predicted DNA binding CopG/RHH family protein
MSKPVDFETLRMGISVLVPIPLREKLRLTAAAKGIPMARLVQELIEEALEARADAKAAFQCGG